MRDVFLTAVVLPLAALTLKRPWIGVLLCVWLGYMNPHRLCYGFAFNFPFFAIAASTTIIGLFISAERKIVPLTREVIVLFLLIVWMNVTVQFALNPEGAWLEWSRVMKIQLMVFITLMAMADRRRLHLLVWVIVLSLGFYGLKGGVFTLVTGGHYIVSGPALSFIEDNNDLALALVMTIPLMRYLQLNTEKRSIRQCLTVLITFTALSVLGSYSRGGLLALSATGILLWFKSRKKIPLAVITTMIVLILLPMMPPEWFNRMRTIETYQQDASAGGRINAWWFAYNLAKDRPFVGGGFRTFTPELFRLYAPNPKEHHAPHSIYFQMLGEQGFPGLFLFLLLGFLTWRSATSVRKQARNAPELKWAGDLAGMCQVSLAAYAIGGAALTAAYFDLPYHLLAFILLCKVLVKRYYRSEVLALEPSVGQPTRHFPITGLKPLGQRHGPSLEDLSNSRLPH